MKNANVAQKPAEQGFTQFELTKNVLHNLKHFNLTPTGKLVLLVLSDCYNPDNGNVVFPSIQYIADVAGIGLTATKQAIKDLINEGLIIKSKRSKINGNRNKYLLTPKVQNTTSEQSENELFKQSDSDRFHEEQKREQKNNKVVSLNQSNSRELKLPKKNVISDDEVLLNYAKKYAKTSVNGYIAYLKKTGADKRIIEDYKAKLTADNWAKNQIEQTDELVKTYNKMTSEPPTKSFKALKAKLLGQR